ncbi:MAG TPA: hypothetical protein VIS99_02195 [Terrimicrobiaceae bacterium]
MKLRLFLLIPLAVVVPLAFATVNDALSFAKEAAAPYAKQGFTVREDAWGGDLGVKDQQAVTAQLFRGNEYWFWLATDTRGATVSVHVYDSEGKLAESDYVQHKRGAAAKVIPKKTGAYYAIVTVEASPQERTNWALVYGFR